MHRVICFGYNTNIGLNTIEEYIRDTIDIMKEN